MKRRGEQQTVIGATVAGVELDDLTVFWELERPEPDVNFVGGAVVNSVWFEDEGDISGDMSDAEMAELEDRLLADLSADAGDYEDMRGDHLRDLQIEERL